jgi:hypothetical protein
MSNAERPGSRYWKLIEPFWIPLNESWDDDPRAFLALFRQVPVAVGHLYASHWCQSEVSNGGLHQFFYNTTGLLAPEALAGFRAVGLHECADVMAEAIGYFGPRYPRERSLRLRRLPETIDQRATRDVFVALDERFYDAEADRWYRVADIYADRITV